MAATGLDLVLGIIYAWSIFGRSLMVNWHWSAPEAALPYAVAIGVLSLSRAPAGRIQDVFGPRFTGSVGGALVGLGLIVSAFAGPKSSMPAIIGFGVITGIGIALGISSAAPPAVKWFSPADRGLVSGIVVAGFSLAALYNAPLTEVLVRDVGINRTFFVLGIALFFGTQTLARLLANPPADYVPCRTSGQSTTKRLIGKKEYKWRETIRSRHFYLFWTMFALTSFAGLMSIGHLAQIVDKQLGLNLGFALVAILAIGNTTGRLAIGKLADRLGMKMIMLIVFLFQAAVMSVFVRLTTILPLVLGTFSIGFTYGSGLALFLLLTVDYFGTKNLGVNFGLIYTGWGIGGVFGSMAAGFIVHVTGSYASAFAIATILSIAGAGLTFLIKPPAVA